MVEMKMALVILLLDIAVCTVLLRIISGWLLNYPRLLRLLLILACLAVFGGLVEWLKLPFADIFVSYLLIPVILVILLSYLPDLTRIYKAASRGMIFSSGESSSTGFIPELAATLYEMASLRRGAILVFAGNEPIDELVSGGEAVEAKLNRSLLLSVFETHCPRHDGAAIIEGDRIVRIGTFLPLASAEGRDVALGTRHLASLGLGQRCDADILVVSEERGSVSHVRGDRIEHLSVDSEEEMQKSLCAIFDVESTDKGEGRARKHNLVLWAIALLVSAAGSIGLWSLESRKSEEKPRSLISVDAKVRLTQIPNGLFASAIKPSSVVVWLNLPESKEIEDSLTVTIDTSNCREGENEIDLTAPMLGSLPPEVVVSRFEPPKIRVELSAARIEMLRILKPELLNARLKVESVHVEPAKLWVIVRDTKWKDKEYTPPPVDLSKYLSPGSHRIQLELNLPASVDLASGQKAPELVVEMVELADAVRE